MTRPQVEALQRELNEFTRERLHNIAPLKVDGRRGDATNRRVRRVKFWLGYHHPIDAHVDHAFRTRLRHPTATRFSDANMRRRGARRRVRQREHMEANLHAAQAASGVTTFDGRPVCSWFVPKLKWAREHGWDGVLVSGYRTPAYSESLCYGMCGRPKCPGTCAGRATNHAKKGLGQGAIDVSDYIEFGELMRRCPIGPRIFNALPRDRVHFSTSGN